ncbi:uncharacterized protein STEHIDRAFT_143093 [Stereum hirsutum FP-91666 SS1]|uniref:Uncharacterized protein n=1 Tax=Stereum hirsutum (strain FP-91666) TaxID=721885 RepID=R7RWA4_STEHR|nr:uncharacterized protein STEHIDRAFT_143093 [Stereum hirsutum FP-91666 SS1]EIM79631.1 hypothetical protein STEHIDRAFT_143093 [Stereum hirsutum FP-91666 SS1]
MSSSGNSTSPSIDTDTVTCVTLTNALVSLLSGDAPSAWSWTANIKDMSDGILQIIVDNPTSQASTKSGVQAVDTLLLRKGLANNVMVFTEADYDNDAFSYSNGQYQFTHKALGAEMFRYSLNFGKNRTSWKEWEATTYIASDVFSDESILWDGQHILMQYWSTYDSGELEIMATWPTYIQLNVYAYDSYYYGDVDRDGVPDRLPPNTAASNYLNMSAPPKPHLAWDLVVDDLDYTWYLEPRGESVVATTMYALLLSIPFITVTLAVVIFMWSFYGIKHNKWGVKPAKDHNHYLLGVLENKPKTDPKDGTAMSEKLFWNHKAHDIMGSLIATLEYEIIDWELKVKIGGLGVLSSLRRFNAPAVHSRANAA